MDRIGQEGFGNVCLNHTLFLRLPSCYRGIVDLVSWSIPRVIGIDLYDAVDMTIVRKLRIQN